MAVVTASCNPTSFRWSSADYSLIDILEKFGHLMPFLFSITQDYQEYKEKRDFKVNQMFWVCGTIKIPKAAAQDGDGIFYSIPENYGPAVIPVFDNNEGEPITMKELLGHTADELHFRFLSPLRADESGNEISHAHGFLKVIETYSDKYLVVHTLSAGSLGSELQLMPVNTPMGVRIALTVLEGGETLFFQSMMNLQDECDTFSKDYSKPTADWSQVRVFKDIPPPGSYAHMWTLPVITTPNDPEPALYHNTAEDDDHSQYEEPCLNLSTAHGISPVQQLKRLRQCLSSGSIPATEIVKNPRRPPQLKSGAILKKQNSNTSSNSAEIEQKGAAILKKQQSNTSSNSAEIEQEWKDEENVYQLDICKVPDIPPKLFDTLAEPDCDTESGSLPVQQYESCTHENEMELVEGYTNMDTNYPMNSDNSQDRQLQRAQWDSALDIPDDISGVTVNEMADCLRYLKMKEHVEMFQSKLVDGDLLTSVLNEEILKSDFGFSVFEAKKLMRFAHGWRPNFGK